MHDGTSGGVSQPVSHSQRQQQHLTASRLSRAHVPLVEARDVVGYSLPSSVIVETMAAGPSPAGLKTCKEMV